MMKERPILFSGAMVRAILDGRKTQTRRIAIKSSDKSRIVPCDFDALEARIELENTFNGERWWKQCPYGKRGDRLWVRETFCPDWRDEIIYKADGGSNMEAGWTYLRHLKWTPSIFMPRLASRITLEIVDVRIERLQDINDMDAQAEGASPDPKQWDACYTDAYKRLWDSINAKLGYGWDMNPWVWVIEFE